MKEKSRVTIKVKRRKTTKKAKYIQVSEAYAECASFEELQSKYNVKQFTIISHLITYVSEGNKINTDLLFSQIETNEEKQKEVFAAFDKFGANYIKPIYDELKETVSYDDLRILKICFLNQS